MRSILTFALLSMLPCAAVSQSNSATVPCGISHWSTTGAACDYAPDLAPIRDRELKFLNIPDMAPLVREPVNSLLKDIRILPEIQITPGKQDSTAKPKLKKSKRRTFKKEKALPPPGGVALPQNIDRMPIIPGDTISKPK